MLYLATERRAQTALTLHRGLRRRGRIGFRFDPPTAHKVPPLCTVVCGGGAVASRFRYYPSNQTKWLGCGAGDAIGINRMFCGLTNASRVPYTDEDLALEAALTG